MRTIINTRPAVRQVNAKMVQALVAGGYGWLMWPSDMRCWAFYGLSILCAIVAVLLVYQAIELIFEIRRNERINREMLKRGSLPKSAKLLKSNDQLKQAGLRD